MLTKLYRVKDLAELTGINASFFYRAIRNGDLKARRRRGTQRGWLVTEDDYNEFVKNGMEVAGGE